jgi:hypothetical protein
LPIAEDAAVTESGIAAAESPGVQLIGREGDRTVYAIESGSYVFVSR